LKILKDLGRISQPVFITQHMPATFTTILAAHISRSTGQKCLEGANHMEVQPGHIYLAPGGMHMIMKRHGSKVFIHLSDGPQENFCRPAIDPMLRSLSDIYGNKLFITILTGMGADGTKGSRYSVEAGAQVIAQDEASSVVWGMPGSVAMAGICGAILPLDKIGAEMQRFAVKGGR
jgi:two-component system chemotaxis response regulator CheB